MSHSTTLRGTVSERRRSPSNKEGLRGWGESGTQMLGERISLEPLIEIGKILAELGLVCPQLVGLLHKEAIVRV